jgi:mRNA interferase HicA
LVLPDAQANTRLPAPATLLLFTKQKCCIIRSVTGAEFKRWLGEQGCTFESGKGGHLKVRLGRRRSVLPVHGSKKEIGKGLTEKIKKDLGLR